jgi:hypothetical protein
VRLEGFRNSYQVIPHLEAVIAKVVQPNTAITTPTGS